LLAIFRACIPDLEPRVIGKPEPLMFEAALRRFGSTPERAVMIGDNPLTDGAGANRIGMASILVGPLGHYASIADLVAR
jgi:HAD superfamily hydrolase (TIGR01509 family)